MLVDLQRDGPHLPKASIHPDATAIFWCSAQAGQDQLRRGWPFVYDVWKGIELRTGKPIVDPAHKVLPASG